MKDNQITYANKGVYGIAVALLAMMSSSAHADIDVAEIVKGISGQVANVETIGLAILSVLVVIAGIALLRRIIH